MADVRRLTEIEGGRWAWVLEVTPEPEAPSGAWCPLNERGCAGECQGDDGVIEVGPPRRPELTS